MKKILLFSLIYVNCFAYLSIPSHKNKDQIQQDLNNLPDELPIGSKKINNYKEMYKNDSKENDRQYKNDTVDYNRQYKNDRNEFRKQYKGF